MHNRPAENHVSSLSVRALDQLMPMHLIISATGHIVRAGPTLAKMMPEIQFSGARLLEIFELQNPPTADSMTDLYAVAGQALRLRFRRSPNTQLKGIIVELPETNGLLLNLSFGISVIEAVQKFNLTISDFAPTELVVEMLYLVEAKSAVMNESRNLNLRLQGARIAAEEQAFTDTLTGLKNRRALEHILGVAAAQHRPFALMQIDLDFFKDVNDTMGHAAGDHVLQHVSSTLVQATRSDDTVARIGGDEFVLVIDNQVDKRALNDLGLRIIRRLEEPVFFKGDPCEISASIGVSFSSDYSCVDPSEMLADADAALYDSKNKGRAQVTLATPYVATRRAANG